MLTKPVNVWDSVDTNVIGYLSNMRKLEHFSAGQNFRTIILWIFCDPPGGGGPIL